MPVSKCSPETEKYLILLMRNENMAKIALSAAKSPTFETLNRQELIRR